MKRCSLSKGMLDALGNSCNITLPSTSSLLSSQYTWYLKAQLKYLAPPKLLMWLVSGGKVLPDHAWICLRMGD